MPSFLLSYFLPSPTPFSPSPASLVLYSPRKFTVKALDSNSLREPSLRHKALCLAKGVKIIGVKTMVVLVVTKTMAMVIVVVIIVDTIATEILLEFIDHILFDMSESRSGSSLIFSLQSLPIYTTI